MTFPQREPHSGMAWSYFEGIIGTFQYSISVACECWSDDGGRQVCEAHNHGPLSEHQHHNGSVPAHAELELAVHRRCRRPQRSPRPVSPGDQPNQGSNAIVGVREVRSAVKHLHADRLHTPHTSIQNPSDLSAAKLGPQQRVRLARLLKNSSVYFDNGKNVKSKKVCNFTHVIWPETSGDL